GVILLCHANLEFAGRMARIWSDGGARVAIHIDKKAGAADVEQMKEQLSDLPGIIYSPRKNCDWGKFSLIEATQLAATALLETWPDCTHVFLASGSCLPLRPIADLCAFLGEDPTCDYI